MCFREKYCGKRKKAMPISVVPNPRETGSGFPLIALDSHVPPEPGTANDKEAVSIILKLFGQLEKEK